MARETRSGVEDERSFLRRWSERKADARREETEAATDPAPVPDAEAPRAIDPADLPDIDSLNAASDFKPFMQAGVPPHLRTLALRKLWRLDPSLANLDGLVDYGEDFTDAGRVVANLQTAYKVGRGFLEKTTAGPKGEPDADEPEALSPEAPDVAAVDQTAETPRSPDRTGTSGDG